jgi:hypothetical protein
MLAFAVLPLLLAAPDAQGGGISAFWTNCGAAGSSMRTFACNTNAGTNDIVCSFAVDEDLPDVTGAVGVIDLCLGGVNLTPWWQFGGAGCRAGALSALTTDVGGPSDCADLWQSQAMASYQYLVGFSGWDSARILVWATLPASMSIPATAGTEYHAFTVRIRNNETVGGCAGCNYPACIVLNEIRLSTAKSGDRALYTPLVYNYLQWQAYVTNCPFVVPVQNRTWGQIKTMYR